MELAIDELEVSVLLMVLPVEPLVDGVVLLMVLLLEGVVLALLDGVVELVEPDVIGALVAAVPLAWVPVAPIGVFCELCCPAPLAGLGVAVVGGLPWAMAVPTSAAVARAAALRIMEAFMERDSLRFGLDLGRISSRCRQRRPARKRHRRPHPCLIVRMRWRRASPAACRCI